MKHAVKLLFLDGDGAATIAANSRILPVTNGNWTGEFYRRYYHIMIILYIFKAVVVLQILWHLYLDHQVVLTNR